MADLETKRERLRVHSAWNNTGTCFLKATDGGGDILVHNRLYKHTHLRSVLPGWEMDVAYIEGSKGRRAVKIYRIIPKEVVLDWT